LTIQFLAKIGRPRPLGRVTRFALAVVLISVAVAISLSMRELAGTREIGVSSIYLSAVILTSWYAGLGPGLLVTAVSIFCIQFFFVTPRDELKFLHTVDEIRTLVFMLIALFTAAFSLSTRAAHEHLARSREELQDFLDTSAIGLNQVGPDGAITWANEAELQMLGYTKGQYIGHHIAEFHVNGALIDDVLARLKRGEALHDFPAQMRRSDGRVLDVLIDSNVLWDRGKFVHARSFTRDVTAEHRARDALVESQRRLRRERAQVQRLYESEAAARADAETAAARTAALESVAAALVPAATPEDVGATVLREVSPALGAEKGRFFLVDQNQGMLKSVAEFGFSADPASADQPVDPDASRASIALTERRGIFVSSSAEEKKKFPQLTSGGDDSWACVPVLAQDEPVAVMEFGWGQAREFLPEDIDLIFAISRLAAQALERARLYKAEQELRVRAEQASLRLSRLQAVTAALGETMTLAQVSDVVLREGMAALEASSGLVATFDRSHAELVVTGSRGLSREAMSRTRFQLDEDVPLARALTTGRPVLLQNRDEAARFDATGVSFQAEEASWAAVPIIHNDEALGVVRFGWPGPQVFDSEQLNLMETLAWQTAQALERARLYQAEQQARRATELSSFSLARLHASRAALARAHTFSEVASVIVTEGVAAIQAKSGTVALLSDDGRSVTVAASTGYPPELAARWEGNTLSLDSDWHLVEPIRSREPIYLPSEEKLASRFPAMQERWRELGIRAIAGVPLLLEDRCFGSLTVAFGYERVLTRGEEDLLMGFANQAAQALDRARLLAAEQAAGKTAERAAAQVAQLQRVTAGLAKAATVADIKGVFAAGGIKLAGASAGAIYLLNDDHTEVKALTSAGHQPTSGDARTQRFEVFPALLHLLESAAPVYISAPQELSDEWREMVSRTGDRSVAWALMPLTQEKVSLGLIALGYDRRPAFDAEQRGMVLTLSRLFALALDRARLYAAEWRLRGRLDAAVSNVSGVVVAR
jgi:PAS domain S-box-containing protein